MLIKIIIAKYSTIKVKQQKNDSNNDSYYSNVSSGYMYHFVNDLSNFNIDKSYKQI